MVNLILDHGAEVNFQDDDGMSPLHFAMYKHLGDSGAALLENGANVNVQNNNGI